MKKMEEEKAARAAEEAKRRQRRKKGPAVGQEVEEQMTDEERDAWWSLAFTIVLTLLLTLSEAFDMDVLIGFALMPFISAMKWLAKELDNQSLDPTVWAKHIGSDSVNFAEHHPLGFVVVDFGIFAFGVVFFLFQADIDKWIAMRKMQQSGYDALEEESGGGGFLSKVAADPEEMQAKLTQAHEQMEHVGLMIRLRGSADLDVMADLNAQHARLEKQIATYKSFLSALETQEAEEVDLEELARQEAEAEAKKKRQGGCAETTKLAVTVIKNAISGIMTIWLYFMDLISDYQVRSGPALHCCCIVSFAHRISDPDAKPHSTRSRCSSTMLRRWALLLFQCASWWASFS